MKEPMFMRDGRWIPLSQLRKNKEVTITPEVVKEEVVTIPEVVKEEVVITEEEDNKKLLELLDMKKHLESLSNKELVKMAKELGMKTAFRTNEEIIKYILNNNK